MLDRFISWLYIRRLWGPRCSEYDPDCPVCEHWREHDEVFGNGIYHNK